MKLVVTGGSGQLGTLVIRRLLVDQEVTRVLNIDRVPPILVDPRLEHVDQDIRGPLARHLEGAAAVFHLAFIVTTRVPPELFESVNVEGSKNVFAESIKAGVPRIIYASSIAAYGVVEGHPVPLLEDSPRRFQPEFPYSSAKFRIEAHLDDLEAAQPKLRVFRLRPAILLGTRLINPLAKSFGDALDRGLIADVGAAPLPLVWDEDVADAAVSCLRADTRGAFNLMSEEPVTAPRLADAFNLIRVPVPRPVARAAATASSLLSRFSSDAVDPSWYRLKDVMMVSDSSRARSELSWSPRYRTGAEVIGAYLARANGRICPWLWAFLKLSHRLQIQFQEAPRSARIHLELEGPGGADVTIAVGGGRISIDRGAPRPPTAVARLSVRAFKEMLVRRRTLAEIERAGEVRFEGDASAHAVLNRLLEAFHAENDSTGPWSVAARGLTQRLERSLAV